MDNNEIRYGQNGWVATFQDQELVSFEGDGVIEGDDMLGYTVSTESGPDVRLLIGFQANSNPLSPDHHGWWTLVVDGKQVDRCQAIGVF